MARIKRTNVRGRRGTQAGAIEDAEDASAKSPRDVVEQAASVEGPEAETAKKRLQREQESESEGERLRRERHPLRERADDPDVL